MSHSVSLLGAVLTIYVARTSNVARTLNEHENKPTVTMATYKDAAV